MLDALTLPAAHGRVSNGPSTGTGGAPARPALVVVGNGMVGYRFCRRAVDLGVTTRHRVVVFGEERTPAYDRVHLTDALSGGEEEALSFAPAEWYDAHGIDLHLGDPVLEIDRSGRVVRSASGLEVAYDRLVLATGSAPRVPPIEGVTLPGVFVYRTLDDLRAIRTQARAARRAAVIGGGLLGLEAARALHGLGLDVTVIEAAAGLMPVQLDQRGALVLERQIVVPGLHVRTATQIRRIEADGCTRIVCCADGERVPVDMVVIATGVRPRSELAARARLACAPDGGVIVDDGLRTSDPAICAIGECASHRSRTYGLVAPGYVMADIAAAAIAGRRAAFCGSVPATRLKLLDVQVATAGDALQGGPSMRFEQGGIYRMLRLERGRLVAALGVGEWPEFNRIQTAAERRLRVWPWQAARFEKTGSLWRAQSTPPVTDWPADAVVCNCLTLTRAQLSAVCAQGAVTVDALVARTGASTLCGSCRPLLAQLTGSTAAGHPTRSSPGLLSLSAAAFAAVCAIALAAPIAVATSVQGSPYPDVLWRDSAYRRATGFALLALCGAAALLTVRKRYKRVSFGSFRVWRAVHGATGVLLLAGLAVHTGFRLGHNLNFALMTIVLLLSVFGAFAGGLTALERRSSAGGRWRTALVLAHVLAMWPLPVLIAFHVLSVYYF